ncbi:hypothetical protein [Lacunimicrobium album]
MFAPDTIARLRRAADQRFKTAEVLKSNDRRLAAVYLFGYSVEMWLGAACFHHAGFRPHSEILPDIRGRRMAFARQRGLMSNDPHPIVGWARFLEWSRLTIDPSEHERQILTSAIKNAEVIYQYWRPELRYKVHDFSSKEVDLVHKSASWFQQNQGKL